MSLEQPVVTLSRNEWLWCCHAGLLRAYENALIGRKQWHNHGGFPWALKTMTTGAIGEFVGCKYFGVFPVNMFNVGGSDVAGHEVKATEYVNGSLCVNAEQLAALGMDDHKAYICVTPVEEGDPFRWCLRGYQVGSYIRVKPREVRGGGAPAYYVPQGELHPIEELGA